ncbi:MAG: hypothetical protein ACOYOK_09590 [Pseudobdellovibrionaceae bacterium]
MFIVHRLKNRICFILFLGAHLVTASAFSNTKVDAKEVGNGGDVVVCYKPNGSIKAVELLDFYEARLKQVDLDVDNIPGNFNNKVLTVLNRLQKFSPVRAEKYLELYKEFFNETAMLKNIELTDVPDSNHIAIPKGCKVEQLVIQKKPVFPGDKRYTFNQDLWDSLDENSKAGIIVHEIIYHEGIEVNNGVQYFSYDKVHFENYARSTAVRFLTSFLFSKDMSNNASEDKLHAAFRMAGYYLDYKGILIQTSNIKRGGGFLADIVKGKHSFFSSYNPKNKIQLRYFKIALEMIGETRLSFDDNAAIRYFTVKGIKNLNIKDLNITTTDYYNFIYLFPENNDISSITSYFPKSFLVSIKDTELKSVNNYDTDYKMIGFTLDDKIVDIAMSGIFQQVKNNSSINSILTFHNDSPLNCVNKRQQESIYDIKNSFFKVGLVTSIDQEKTAIDTPQGQKNFVIASEKDCKFGRCSDQLIIKEKNYCTYFDDAGYAKEGPVLKGEIIQTKNGAVKLVQDSLVQFLSGNDAIITSIQ